MKYKIIRIVEKNKFEFLEYESNSFFRTFKKYLYLIFEFPEHEFKFFISI